MVTRYLLADALSLLGNAVAAVAVPWLVLSRTGDAAAAGLVAAVATVPMLLATFVGGIVIDRVGRRRTSVGSDLASAAAVAAIPLVDTVGGLTIGAFVALAIAGAVFDGPGMTAREALAPDIAAAAGLPVERLAGLREGVGGVMMIIGPAVAGGLMLLTGPTVLLWGTAACSALAALVTATLPVGVGAAVGDRQAFGWSELTAGITVLRREKVLGAMTILSTAAIAVLAPLQGILLPVHMVAQGDPGALGLMITFMALGGIAGAGLYAAFGARLQRRTVFVLSMVTMAAGVTGIALLPATPLMFAAAVLTGIGNGPLPALLMVLITERIPDGVRGRVLGLQNTVVLAAAPIGLLGAGVLIESIGVRPTGMLVAGAWILVTVMAMALPALRRLEPQEEVVGC